MLRCPGVSGVLLSAQVAQLGPAHTRRFNGGDVSLPAMVNSSAGDGIPATFHGFACRGHVLAANGAANAVNLAGALWPVLQAFTKNASL